MANITFDDLNRPGKIMTQYDFKVLKAAFDHARGDDILHRDMNRKSKQMQKLGIEMTGRQALRLIMENFKTDETSKELYNINHLTNLRYPGDANMASFLQQWHRLLDDQDDPVSDKKKEHLFHGKIKGSSELSGHIAYYGRLKKGHPDRSYDYLVDAMTDHIKEKRMDRNLPTSQQAALIRPQAPS